MKGIPQTSRARVSLPGGASPRWGCPGSRPPGSPGPSLCFCLPGGPGLPRERGAAHHRPGARGRLHLLPEAAAAPDDRAEQQGRGQWVQLQRHSRSWVCTGYLCSLSPPPCSPLPPCMSLGRYHLHALSAVMKNQDATREVGVKHPVLSRLPGPSWGPRFTRQWVPWFITHPRAFGGGRALLSTNSRGS